MKKIGMILLSIIMVFILTSCTVVEGDVSERISSPDNNIPPILGKWEIDEVVKKSYQKSNSDDAELLIGREGLFHEDAVVIGDSHTTEPSFKIKNVKAVDYLLYKYKASPKILGIDSDVIEVITILNENTYFYEFIKINENKMLINIDDTFYSMVKTVEEISLEEIERYINVEKSIMRTFGAVEEEKFQSGILIGIKTPSFDELNQVPIWEYKTIWVNSQNGNISGIYELDKLLMPRKNGFWIIENKRVVLNDSVSDELTAIPQFRVADLDSTEDEFSSLLANNSFSDIRDLNKMNELSKTSEVTLEQTVPSILKNILFIGNDYISVENVDLDRDSRRTLQVYAIDNLDEKKPIKLSDLIGENGKDIFAEGVRSVVSQENNVMPNEENVGLIRKNGYWIIKGRINYKQNEEELYKDFNLKAIPPKEMVSFDEQAIHWDAIRLILPDVVDVFSSPNNDFIVVITGSNIVVYNLQDGDIINDPVAKIKFPYDSSVIMSEWAVGRYPTIWENELINSGGVKIEY